VEVNILAFARLKRYEEALEMIVERLGDDKRAEEFCLERDAEIRRELRERITNATPSIADALIIYEEPKFVDLFHSLLQVYVNIAKRKKQVPTKAVQLLNQYPYKFDPIKVLEIMPDDLPIQELQEFLLVSLRNSHHMMRDAQVIQNLEESEKLKYQLKKIELSSVCVQITRDTFCQVC